MKKLALLSTLILFIVSGLVAQTYENELGFKYIKAEYLVKTVRFDEALKELTDVIKENPGYKDALLLRAEVKYKLAGYKAAKTDVLLAIEAKGITKDLAALLGRIDYALDNTESAYNSLGTAMLLGSTDEKVLLEHATIAQKVGNMEVACQDWAKAARAGSTTAMINSNKFCGGIAQPNVSTQPNTTTQSSTSTQPSNTPVEVSQPSTDLPSNTATTTQVPKTENGPSDSANVVESTTTTVEPINNANLPPEDNTINTIEVDEDLTIDIMGQGMGKRKVLERPSILILSETDGVVAVEICVNENGRVSSADFNQEKSTITNRSLVELAIRKGKEFWFERSDFRKQCGFVLFKIKGSN